MDKPEQREVRDRVTKTFFDISEEDALAPLKALVPAAGPLARPATTLHANLLSVVRTTSLPFLLMRTSVVDSHLSRLRTAEAIRMLKDGAVGDTERVEAHRRAGERLSQHVGTVDGMSELVEEIALRLHSEIQQEEVATGAQELLRQNLVMTWGSLEVFVSDFIRELLNDEPTLGVALLSSEHTRKHFGGKGSISVEAMAAFDFNLSKKMGDFVLSFRRLDALNVMGDTLKVVCPTMDDAQRAVKNPQLRLLNQRRHLIVHRRSVIDAAFLQATGLPYTAGEEMIVTTDDCRAGLAAVIQLGSALLAGG